MTLQIRVMQPWNGIGGNGEIDPFRVMSGNLGTEDPMDGSILFTAREGEMAFAELKTLAIPAGRFTTDRASFSGSILTDLQYPEFPMCLCVYQNPDGRLWYPGNRYGGAEPTQIQDEYRFNTSLRRWNANENETDGNRFVLDFTLGTSSNANTITAPGILVAYFIGVPLL